MKAAIRSSLLVLVAALAASCAPSGPQKSDYLRDYNRNNGPTGKGEHHSAPAIPDDISYWDGEGATGAPLVRINRGEQKAYFYKGGQLVAISKISSGNEDHGTPPGRYKITQKDKDHKSSTYGAIKDKATGQMVNDNADIRTPVLAGQIYYPAPMPYFMRFADGIGMHTGYLPGYAASHGCIRMPDHMARHFFENVEVGTPVIVE
ncbi:MAG: L,D-transpeptidase family protein [Luteolibacter sp.]